ncbi:putative bifunctional diguanylate cyclase/phosphodiesterase [Aeromonas caviae]|uniref:putative bifunctional diguanylate cyclase/phosphodiesterase n=1 Tax=Aeromonas TaxID=642 RepID=UPI0004D59354|nr:MULTISPECIES: EAL domain-containing protein [Aeromonas]AUT41955.1 bifunctional diguanylate cyclase/phosphodiesterase [Aeromonas sp. ASNIH5]KDV03606.1 diguanylate phosphodiesterase [Aeromonas sp. HZM]MDH0027477.1 EAL domain-containing protein [Aeromonas caviae]MDH0308550.1 EAL domain-containing protein [Aeromonas caviae]MDH1079202.1 EAL domain-containing protein [Aeromonas caviae]
MTSSLSLALLQQIIDQLPMNIFCRDTHGRYLFANKAFAREAGLQDPSELIGKSDAEMPWGDVFREEDDRLLADGKPLLHQQLHCHSGEGASWMEINKVPLYDEHGDPIALFAMVSAIDQRKELEQTFRQQQLLQRRLLDAIPDLIRLEDHQGVLIDCNQAFLDFMGLVASEALGRRVPPRLPVEQTLGQGEYCVVDAQGRGRHLEVTRVEVPDDEGNSLGILTLSRDITGLRTTQAQLQQEQHYDSLTGLLKLSHFLQTSRHLGARKASLLLVDLQHFREINDRFGIRVADRLLSQVARRLQRLAPPQSLLCRVAADDFALLLPELPLSLDAWSRNLQQELMTPYQVEEHRIQIPVFLGIAHGKAKDAERLLSHAEAALAQGKRQQQHCTLFDPALDAKLKRRQLIAAQLPLAIKSAELTAVYQPIICTHSNRLHGAELLCRWPHPEFGMISPDEFIPLAEELGLIGQLGQLMLELGCAQLARWQVAAPDLVLSINLSPLQFRDPELCPQIFDCIARHGLAPWQLELEITEGVLMENADEIESNLASLIEAGFQLAIDDFGTGYCSLAYLPRLQVATLKLDKSFTQGLATNQATTAIVRSVIGLGHELGIKITAEGVETPEQQAWLVQVGCDRLQGYLFSRPLPPADFARSYQLPEQ